MSVSDFHAAAGGTIAALGVGLTAFARAWPTTNPAKHRAAALLPSEEVLCGPPSAYTAVDPNAETQAFGVLRTGFGWCPSCESTTAGVISRNGFRCGEFYRHQERAA